MKVNLQWATENAEYNMAYCARVSSIKNQDNKEFKKLFRYCLQNNHWSVFQMSSMCLGVETSLAVATQIMRHWSLQIHEPLDMQMLSQRYTSPIEHGLDFQPIELRRKASSNRQSSEQPLEGDNRTRAEALVNDTLTYVRATYNVLSEMGVANECIRMIFPQAVTSRFFISGSCRSWIHYLEQRTNLHAQKEHRELAIEIENIFKGVFPTVYAILSELRTAENHQER